MRTGDVTTNDGVRLHYVEAGAGPDLLLVAGWTLTAGLWRHQIGEFSRTHHVVAYDHRGHGESGHPSYGYRVARLAAEVGAPHTAEGLPAFTAALRGPQADEIAAAALDAMVTGQLPPGERAEILSQMLLTGRETASLLMFSNATQDWRDLLPQITVPVLVIGGGVSMFPAASLLNMAAAIPGAAVRIIPAADRGSHLSILENPAAVNDAIREFLDSTA